MNFRPIIPLLFCLLGSLSFSIQAQQTGTNTSAPKKIINYGGGGWKDGQANEPCILVNPKDKSKLIMFYSGMKLGGSAGAIGKAWANVAEHWYLYFQAAHSGYYIKQHWALGGIECTDILKMISVN